MNLNTPEDLDAAGDFIREHGSAADRIDAVDHDEEN